MYTGTQVGYDLFLTFFLSGRDLPICIIQSGTQVVCTGSKPLSNLTTPLLTLYSLLMLVT